MKNLSIIILLLLSNNLNSQIYLESNPEWTEYSVACGGGNPYCSSQEYTIKLEADTTIGNTVYFKTKREGTTTTWDWTVDTLVSINPINDYFYPLREEQGKFLMYNISLNEEQLLHDFNLIVGDTAISPYCQNPQIVMEIDTVYFGTQMRKKFIFAPQLTWGTSPLFEGIGTSRGLFVRPCSGVIGIESGSTLQCFTTDNETIQIDTSGQCETTIPVSTINLTKGEFELYPNPFNEKIIIESKGTKRNEVKIKLYDFQGKLLNSKSMLNADNLIEISTKELIPGRYILIIQEEDKIHTSKMIKIKK